MTNPNTNIDGPGTAWKDFQRIQLQLLNLRADLDEGRDSQERVDQCLFVARLLAAVTRAGAPHP